jgi:hypothetical protein
MDKHSSLFSFIARKRRKKFYDVDTRLGVTSFLGLFSSAKSTMFSSGMFPTLTTGFEPVRSFHRFFELVAKFECCDFDLESST